MSKLLTTAEAAARKGVPLATLQRWIRCRWLRAKRVPPGANPRRQSYFVSLEDLDAFEPPRRGPKRKSA